MPDGGRPQLSRPAEEQLEKRGPGGSIAREIEMKHLVSLGHVKMLDALEHGQGRLSDDRLLRGALNHTVGDGVLRKKLLRAFAALSPGAVVPPVERARGCRHKSVLCGWNQHTKREAKCS